MDAAPTDTDEERDLLAAARAGDAWAFGRLVGLHRPGLESYCHLMLGCPHRAERAVGVTLVSAWHGLGQAGERPSPRIWLYRIATRACMEDIGGRDEVAAPPSSNPPWS